MQMGFFCLCLCKRPTLVKRKVMIPVNAKLSSTDLYLSCCRQYGKISTSCHFYCCILSIVLSSCHNNKHEANVLFIKARGQMMRGRYWICSDYYFNLIFVLRVSASASYNHL